VPLHRIFPWLSTLILRIPHFQLSVVHPTLNPILSYLRQSDWFAESTGFEPARVLRPGGLAIPCNTRLCELSIYGRPIVSLLLLTSLRYHACSPVDGDQGDYIKIQLGPRLNLSFPGYIFLYKKNIIRCSSPPNGI
jgi:hypothetical protein